jgi:hypothetical protein
MASQPVCNNILKSYEHDLVPCQSGAGCFLCIHIDKFNKESITPLGSPRVFAIVKGISSREKSHSNVKTAEI